MERGNNEGMEEIQLDSFWENNKNGELYRVCRLVHDATNGREGTVCVLYYRIRTGKHYVREYNEFLKKFRRVR